MSQLTVFGFAFSLVMAVGCGTSRCRGEPQAGTPAGAGGAPVARVDQAPTSPPGVVDSLPPQADPDTHASRGLDMHHAEPSTVEPSRSIPSPAATLDPHPPAGGDASAAVPANVPVGHLGKDLLESPLKDRKRFERCSIPRGTRVDINAVVYNGAAVNVDVRSTPPDRALNFCVEHVVRETSWVKELAVNRVRVTL